MATLSKVMKNLQEIPVLMTSCELITFARGIVFNAVKHYLFPELSNPQWAKGPSLSKFSITLGRTPQDE